MDKYWDETNDILNESLIEAKQHISESMKCKANADETQLEKSYQLRLKKQHIVMAWCYSIWQNIWNWKWEHWNEMAGIRMNKDGNIIAIGKKERNDYNRPLQFYQFYKSFFFKTSALYVWTVLLALIAMASSFSLKHF